MNHRVVAIIIENQDGDFLLHLRDDKTPRFPNQWCLVAGLVEPDEDILSAAIREVKEETALTLTKPLHLKEFIYDGRSVALFQGTVNTIEEKMILGEGADLKFFPRVGVVSFVNSLGYSNPHLKEFLDYVRSLA